MFEVLKTEGRARRGVFTSVHGTAQTPVFMNVGTSAAIKGAVSTMDLYELGCQIELSNTYHLHIRPGDDVIRDMGGKHKFFNWERPVLTDSGGFQESSAEEIHDIRAALDRENWHLLDEDGREEFLLHYLPYNRREFIDLFADFRNFGFRILSDIIADLDDMYVAEERKKNAVRTDTDSELVNDIMKHYLKGRSKDYRDLAASRTRRYLNKLIDADKALMCVVALKKRDFAMDVLLDRIADNAVKG